VFEIVAKRAATAGRTIAYTVRVAFQEGMEYSSFSLQSTVQDVLAQASRMQRHIVDTRLIHGEQLTLYQHMHGAQFNLSKRLM
jgi:hypothetical protein